MTTVLILGASGNLASRVTTQLASTPAISLRLTSSRDEGVDALRAAYPDAEAIKADWYDTASLNAAFDGADRVLVIPPDFTTDEGKVTPNIIAAARSSTSIEQIVRLLANAPDQRPETMDQEWKDTHVGSGLHPIAKALLDESGLPVTYVNVGAWIGFNLPWFVAEDVKRFRQVRLPHDSKRPWLDEADIAEAFAAVLVQGPARHVGRTHLLTSADRYRFADLARVISDEIGETITYVDTQDGIRASMGESAEPLITYLKHEKEIWDRVPVSDDLEQLIGRAAVTLPEYVHANRTLFL